MRKAVAAALTGAIVVAVPAILIGNALWVLTGPWLVEAQYALPGFPDDPHGLDRAQRTELARTGVRSIRPFDEGTALLREARLPDGRAAFAGDEVRHMQDVRDLVGGFLALWAVALAIAVAAALALRRRGEAAAARRALARGGTLTLGAIGLVALFMLVAFDAFFTAFHSAFFAGDSWRFADSATLRRLYPDAFWAIAAAAMAVLVLAQAAVIALGLRHGRDLRRMR